jgi:hypothetical protein
MGINFDDSLRLTKFIQQDTTNSKNSKHKSLAQTIFTIDFSPDMGSQSTERRSVCRRCRFVYRSLLWLPHSPCVTRLSADVRSPSRDKSAAPYQRQGFVEGMPCRSCGCFSTIPLASMVRTLVSLVDVPDAISLRALAGTPLNTWTPLHPHNTQEFPGPLELT